MVCVLPKCRLHNLLPSPQMFIQDANPMLGFAKKHTSLSRLPIKAYIDSAIHVRKQPKHQRYPPRTKLPPNFGAYTFIKQEKEVKDCNDTALQFDDRSDDIVDNIAGTFENGDEFVKEDENDVWEADEIDAISSLFQGRIPQKPGKLNRERPLPLPRPHKIRPPRLPTKKMHIRSLTKVSPQLWQSKQVYKDPVFLLKLAKKIRSLPVEEDVSCVLNQCGRFLRKGSLSLTIRDLGHSGHTQRALQTFCWAQKQTHLFPDNRILATTVEILARARELKLPFDLEKFISLASGDVLEAIAKGFIKGGNLSLAWKLLCAARDGKRMLDSSVYAKLILELGKNPDKDNFVGALLEELSGRENLNLSPQDCTAIMKVCVRLQKFDLVECLFDWFQTSGNQPSVVMYTTVIHSRFSGNRHREAMDLVWKMESADCVFDLPAYRVLMKLFVGLNDLPRGVRYYAKMKEAGFTPTYDIYRYMIYMYLNNGRYAKCKQICKEVELAGFKLDAQLKSQLLQLEGATKSGV